MCIQKYILSEDKQGKISDHYTALYHEPNPVLMHGASIVLPHRDIPLLSDVCFVYRPLSLRKTPLVMVGNEMRFSSLLSNWQKILEDYPRKCVLPVP